MRNNNDADSRDSKEIPPSLSKVDQHNTHIFTNSGSLNSRYDAIISLYIVTILLLVMTKIVEL